MKLKATEAQIQKSILEYLSYSKVGTFWRQNSGAAVVGEGSNRRFISFGRPGAGDITGILKDGRRCEIEVKTATGKQNDNQKAFQLMIEEHNGIYILARGIEDLRERNL